MPARCCARRCPTPGPNKREAEIRPRVGISAGARAPQFAIALFAGYDRPTVKSRTVGLEDLVHMLTTFDELADKRQARCWSPTRYATGMTSRSNAGVAAVSALVFAMDKVLPDPNRLAGMCWIGHTTWSHTPEAPRWRVVVPLAQPVPATSWGDMWRRARARRTPVGPTALMQLAEDIGAVLAGIHSVTFPEQGFLDGALNVVPFPPGIGGPLVEFLTTLLGSHGRARLGPELTQALMTFAERESDFGAS